MATYQKRGEYWRAIVRKKGFPAVSKTFDTKTEAESWAKETETDMHKRKWQDVRTADRLTLSDALDRYYNEVSLLKKSADQERKRVKLWKASSIAQRPLSTITSFDLSEWRDERLKRVSGTTVNLDLALISHLFTVAQKDWGMPFLTNPVSTMRKPTHNAGARKEGSKHQRDRRLQDGELEKILNAVSSEEVKTAILLAVYTGMRRSEIINLNLNQIDFKNRTITLEDTKNGEKRVVPLSKSAVTVLQSARKGVVTITGNVFSCGQDWISQAFLAACKKIHIKDLRFHDLRHEAISRLFEAGLTTEEVMSISGHKTYSQLKRYTQITQKHLISKLDNSNV